MGSGLRDQDLPQGTACEALLLHEVQLQVPIEIGEGAEAGADREGHHRELVLVDEAEADGRSGEGRAAVDEDRAVVLASLELGDRRGGVAEDLDRAPVRLLQGGGEDRLGLLVHGGRYRALRGQPVGAHDLVAAPAHRVGPGFVEGAAVPLGAVVAEELEHPVMRPVGARRKAVEGQHHLENYFSVWHIQALCWPSYGPEGRGWEVDPIAAQAQG